MADDTHYASAIPVPYDVGVMITACFHRVSLLIVMAASSYLGGCHQTAVQQEPAKIADGIFTGGQILTVSEAVPVVEAVAVKDGKNVVVGNRDA